MSDVIDSAENVKNVSVELARGSSDLMHRTQSQAASIEETAASMDELSTTVRNNTDSALEAEHVASAAHREAENGAAVMRESVIAMNAMGDAARRIEEIITLIDGIAFQTNILALNAAVEAARAGDHGRGFAVVAGEVRQLAQRSAVAAKDIEKLIAATSSRIDEGARLVETSGQSLDRIRDGVRKVSQIIASIARASQEQASGISQVGKVVTEMDQTTQQNAGLVEETAAAAESLPNQAEELQLLAARFTVNDSDQHMAFSFKRLPSA